MNPKLLQDLLMVTPLAALFLISLIPITIKVINSNREPRAFFTLIYGFIGLAFAIGLTASIDGTKKAAFSNAIVIDGISVWGSYLVYGITAVALMLAFDNFATRGKQFAEFLFLMISSACGMIVLLMSNDLIVTFIGIEMMSLCLYILVAMSKEEILSKEAAFKYFVIGSFASAILLYGIAFIYGSVGSTYFPDIAAAAPKLIGTNRLFLVGFAMLILGLGFKVAMFPLHAWAPDVYEGAPTPVTAFMSTAVKVATFAAFLRLFNSEALASAPRIFEMMQWLAVLTIIVGNVAAVMQDNMKRMLAYSSIAHSGYILIGLLAAGFGGNFKWGAAGVLFYLFSYSIMTLGSFALISLIEDKENTRVSMQNLKGLAHHHPLLALSLSVLMLSLAGIPPTLGFFGKFYIFSAAIEQDMYWLVFWGIIGSVISVYFYLRPIVYMYMSEATEENRIKVTHHQTRIALVASAVLVIVLGICSSSILAAVQRSVDNMF